MVKMKITYFYLPAMLNDCPPYWREFVKHHNPDVNPNIDIDDALAEYGSKMFELEGRQHVVVFPNQEEYTRFILTWS